MGKVGVPGKNGCRDYYGTVGGGFPAKPLSTSICWQAGGVEPLWAHSGRELLYRNGVDELGAVQVSVVVPN